PHGACDPNHDLRRERTGNVPTEWMELRLIHLVRDRRHHDYAQRPPPLNPPPTNESTAKMRNTTKRIFATPTKEPAIPPKPSTAAIKAMMRQVIANCNMVKLSENKKAGVAEHPKVFCHVGLLTNEPPRHSRAALYLVIRQTRSTVAKKCPATLPTH